MEKNGARCPATEVPTARSSFSSDKSRSFLNALPSKTVDKLVGVAMGADFVSGSMDAAHQVGVVFGDMPEHKEGGFYPSCRQQVEQFLSTYVNSVFEPAPFLGIDLQPLVPVLQVDGKGVLDRGRSEGHDGRAVSRIRRTNSALLVSREYSRSTVARPLAPIPRRS